MAGVVAVVGPGAQRFRPGDEVYGTSPRGTYAEYVATNCKRLAPKPAVLSFEQAAVAARPDPAERW
jgi:NADPH:quinone reductase-like Zn-dependent oxidoreductase